MDEDRDSRTIQGCLVSFNAKPINHVFCLLDIERDEYIDFIRREMDVTSIIKALYGPGANWVFRSGVLVKIKGTDLTISSQI